MATRLKDGQTVLFIGDSITDCGRSGTERPLGNGYVKMFWEMLVAREPGKRITVINKGIGGDRVPGLQRRWTDDVLRHRPDWLVVKIGINDLHSHLFGNPIEVVTPAVYAKAYDEILTRTRARLPRCQILLIEPFYISQDTSPHSVRKQVLDALPKYLAVVRAMHRKHRTRLVRTHSVFQAQLRFRDTDTFCPEPVHPNHTGHMVIADAVYAALR